MVGNISSTAWPGNTLLVMCMRCKGEERMQLCIQSNVYSQFFGYFVYRPLHVQLCADWMYTVYIVYMRKINIFVSVNLF